MEVTCQNEGEKRIFTKMLKVSAAWRSIALAVGLKEVVPTLEVITMIENHPDFKQINHPLLVAMLMVCRLLMWSVVKMSCRKQITFDNLND